jgi:diguanylate cyclase (GGDEF)-like protein
MEATRIVLIVSEVSRLRSMTRKSFGLFATLVLTAASRASTPDMLFARLGSDQGLSHGAIRAIVQDADGFMWFGTEDGMDRYDGYELRHFIHHRGDPVSLPNEWVSALASDHAGRLWVGGVGGGVVWRETRDGSFRVPRSASGAPLLDTGARVRALTVDRQGRLWIATRDRGVDRLDLDHAGAVAYRHRAGDAGSLSDDSVFAIAEGLSGEIWIGGNSGLDRLDPKSGRIEHFAERLRSAGVPAEALKVNALCVDGDGKVWVGLDVGLVEIDPTTGILRLLRHSDDEPHAMPNGRVNSLLEDRERRLWLGLSTGLALLDRHTGQAALFTRDPTNSESLPDNNVTSLYQDRGGLLWIGTKTGGVARWNPRSWAFGLHGLANMGDGVTGFMTDAAHTLWIGTFGGGLLAIEPETGRQTRYWSGAKSPFALPDDDVMALASDEQGRVWLGTMNHGILRLDPARRQVRQFESVAADATTLPANGIMTLLRDAHDRLWVGTYGGGLARIDLKNDRVVRYAHGRDDESGLSGDRATALAEDRNGLLWIGTDGGGLNVLDPVSGRFAHFRHDANLADSLSGDTVYTVHVDAAGEIWAGTRGGGLDRISGDPFAAAGLHFKNLGESEGLPDSTVYGIESDSSGNLWISTNRGVAMVRPGDGKIRTFRHSHGLQGDEFNFGAHYRAPDGTLYFGGPNGYNAFDPERLSVSEASPQIVLTDVVKLNQHVVSPESLKELNLGYRDSVITLRFAALDFTGPAENHYAYRLVGFDKDWVYAGDARQASYTDLSGGDYVFEVKTANDDVQWSGVPLALPIHVASPPWATGWAKAFYCAAALGVAVCAWLAYRRRGERQAQYARRLEREVELRTAELAERNRDMQRANQRLHEASLSDLLTGLGNRRSLHDAMAALIHESDEVHFVLLIIDLDDLKPINDTYGHEAGDAVLLEIAAILRRECRDSDRIVRWGGDEFIVMRPDADLAEAGDLAERICASVVKMSYRTEGGQTARTSCSIGFAQYPFIPSKPRMLDWEETLSIADIALYEAKRERNHWLGLAGTDKTAEFPSVKAALANGLAAAERDGAIIVRRRPVNPNDPSDLPRRNRRTEHVTT